MFIADHHTYTLDSTACPCTAMEVDNTGNYICELIIMSITNCVGIRCIYVELMRNN